jgi:hypothetical protein
LLQISAPACLSSLHADANPFVAAIMIVPDLLVLSRAPRNSGEHARQECGNLVTHRIKRRAAVPPAANNESSDGMG